ncbi:MAG: hypothetical protein Q9227_005779 [Pyrenula ochraceoflavens]
MPPKKAPTTDASSDIKMEDAIYLVKCFQHSTTDTVVSPIAPYSLSPPNSHSILNSHKININDVGAALNTKPHNVTCRISALKQKYNLNIRCTAQGGPPGTPTKTPTTPSKRVKASDAASPNGVTKVKKESDTPAKKKRAMKKGIQQMQGDGEEIVKTEDCDENGAVSGDELGNAEGME